MLEKYNLKMPKCVYAGKDAIENIQTIVKDGGFKKIALFTDKGIEAAGLDKAPLSEIEKTGIPFEVFDELPSEPTYEQAQKLVDQCKKSGADLIIAVGGGSVLDTAKLASVLITDEYGIKELLDTPLRAKKCIKLIAIPTTSGTGSEATPNSIVAVPEKELKIGIVNPELIPDYVILDVNMVKALPRKIAASTGVDALAHAIECFTSNKANPFSDLYALKALNLILNSIEEACDNKDAIEAKSNMQIASFYAGIAITASGTTAVHALSYPLGGKYHIPHGTANAMLLAPVMKFNEPSIRPLLAKVYDNCIGGNLKTEEEKSTFIIDKLFAIVKHLDIPTSLEEFNVPKDDLETLVKAGMEVKRLLDNNMRKVTEEDAREIYMQLF